MEQAVKDPRDKWIPRYFVIFFVVIALLDGFFVYMAVSTQTGVVVKQPYQKGLAFNDTLEKARTQPDLKHSVSYSDGVLRWALPMEEASVVAHIIRPVQDGHDFNIKLTHTGGGVYEAKPEMPLPGVWTAKLKATWNNNTFQTSHDLMVQ